MQPTVHLLPLLLLTQAVRSDYWQDRNEFIANEEAGMLGGSVKLSAKEEVVNQILMSKKLEEYDAGFKDPKKFLPAYHLFDTLEDIERSEVFKFIQSLPKGAMLHGHDTALVSGEFLYNLTFSEDLYTCYVGEKLKLHFFKEPVEDNTCSWVKISTMRDENPQFEADLKSQITLIRPDYREVYTDVNAVWSHFMDIFILVEPLICYKPIFQKYFYQVLEELHEDNVMYLEFRSLLPLVYDLDGTVYNEVEVAGLYYDTMLQFIDNNPDFLGAKLIYAPLRGVDNQTMDAYIDIARDLIRNYPEFLAGFDLVGQEDLGHPLTEFINQLQDISQDIDFFFHAGETNWFGTSTDFNLVDAVMLGTKRIGHAYAVLKHPGVAKLVKERGVAIEICPISNQVLHLIGDMRNHPGNFLIADNYPVVITNDDPSFWGAKALSHDWYMAFMGMASRSSDLRFLKQLALNSLLYSAHDDVNMALVKWEGRWDAFLDKVLAENNIIKVLKPKKFKRYHMKKRQHIKYEPEVVIIGK